MWPPRTRLDPQGYYARLGLEPVATQAAIVAAFRTKARLLHPDVPATGNAEAFVAVRQAYDVLSNRERRAAYDSKAREAAQKPVSPEPVVTRPAAYRSISIPVWPVQVSGPRIAVWVGLGAFLCLCVYQAATHMLAPSHAVSDGIRPNAASVEPLSPSAEKSVLYGPAPVRLAGSPNFYVLPAGTPATLWRTDAEHDGLAPVGQLPPFSQVQAVRLIRQTGMLEVLVNDRGNGFISADHLTPGDARAARLAYCSYNSGPTPSDGETLARRGSGSGTLLLENRAMQPAVVKLRDETGAAVIAVFLAPGGQRNLNGLPDGLYRPEFAIGEVWSRACNIFAAGMRARRMDAPIRLPAHVVIAADGAEPAASDISEQAFERD